MATNLKDLKIHKVDFVTAGANPDAHIRITKQRKASDGDKSDNGFAGRLYRSVAKVMGWTEEEANQELINQIVKSSEFADKMQEINQRKVMSQMWDLCNALTESLGSIITDEDVADKETVMTQNLEEFTQTAKAAIAQWAKGEQVETIGKAVNEDGKKDNTISKGDEGNMAMEIDRSKLLDVEKAAYDAILKKAGAPVEPEEEDPKKKAEPEEEPEKKKKQPCTKAAGDEPLAKGAGEADGEEDIYKGMSPAVKAEFLRMKKSLDEAEDREMEALAKKYELLGNKPEELAPILKSLKQAEDGSYEKVLGILDDSLAAVEKSGLFSEIGKSGHAAGGSGAVAKAEAKAEELRKSRPELTKEQAMAEVWKSNPELMAEYEEE